MNCKPGDLAFLAIPPRAEFAGLVVEVLRAGKPQRLKKPFGHLSGASWWVRASRACMTTRGIALTEFVLPDAALKPIRDPGDDAVDESLLWLRVPTKEIA